MKIWWQIILILLFIPFLPGWIDPTSGRPYATTVLRPFDPPAQRWLTGHRGVDLALSVGAEVQAAGSGNVVFAGTIAGTPVVSIQHDGFRTTYQPVHARVAHGEYVSEGQVIGTLGHSTDGYPGLHWGARRGSDEYFNPLLLLRPTIRLKPVDELG